MAWYPTAVLTVPVVFENKVWYPQLVFPVVPSINPDRRLFTRIFNGILSVVPIKLVAGFVPLFPFNNQPTKPAPPEPKVPSPRRTSVSLPENFIPYTTPFASCLKRPAPFRPVNVSSRKPPAT